MTFRQKQDAYRILVGKPQGKMDLREVYVRNCELN
jgi:hypothetical protein